MRTDARTLGWAAGLLLLGATLSFVPLAGVLGYEFAFLVGLAAALAGAHLGAQAVLRARAGAARSDRERADATPGRVVFGLLVRTVVTLWAILLLPLLCITLNALRVRNCNFLGGLEWFVVLPLASAVTGAAAGITTALLVPTRRRAVVTALALSIPLASVLLSVWRFWSAPPICAYDPFGGYFPGTVYDEEVAIQAPLWWARAYHFACAAAALATASLFLDGRSFALRLSAARGRGRAFFVALAAAALVALLGASHARLGFGYSAGEIARALGGTLETEHFVLHYSPAGPFARDLALHAADHEFRWAQLRALFGVAPEGKVHSYLFDDTRQKQALLGASHTSIAKPWRREIYLQADGWPHPVLAHELAHVFAGAFGDPIFHASRRGLEFNVGLIEGVATAAAWSGAPLTPHQQVKTLRALGVEPPLARVLSLDFLRMNGASAYAVAGSFARFLLDRYGAAPLEQVYRAGGSERSWQAAYGVPLAELAAGWSKLIDGVTVPESARELERARLTRPSVLHKVCAHELALRREAARRAQAAGERTGALAMLHRVVADDPDDPSNLVELMDAEAAANLPAEAERTARALERHPKATAAIRARGEALLGDQALAAGDSEGALAHYQAALGLPLAPGDARLVEVKRIAAREPPGPIREGLIHFLVPPATSRDPALDLFTVARLVEAAPERGLFHYLLGRQLDARARPDEAVRELARSVELGLPDERFVREALRLEGAALFRLGRWDASEAAWRRLQAADTAGVRIDAEDWIARLRFARGQK